MKSRSRFFNLSSQSRTNLEAFFWLTYPAFNLFFIACWIMDWSTCDCVKRSLQYNFWLAKKRKKDGIRRTFVSGVSTINRDLMTRHVLRISQICCKTSSSSLLKSTLKILSPSMGWKGNWASSFVKVSYRKKGFFWQMLLSSF